MPNKTRIVILAIETSADETGAAVLLGDKKTKKFKLLSNVIHSQIKTHRLTGGIVPEVAAREHIPKIIPLIELALKKSKTRLKDVSAIAVAGGPGLVTSLRIGVDTAKTLAYALGIPLIPVNHMEGHLLSAFDGKNYQNKSFPALGLVVSGGHTMLVLVKKIGQYKILGQTVDDAAGECFDKVAKILSLPYPGGPALSKLAEKGNPEAFDFPRPMLNQKNFNFSFSGLKTAVLYDIQKIPRSKILNLKPDVCASVEQAIVDVLVAKTIHAAKRYRVKTILLGGGVSANKKLRTTLGKTINDELPNAQYQIPNPEMTTDNAGMIALAGFYHYTNIDYDGFKKVTANPNWELTSWR